MQLLLLSLLVVAAACTSPTVYIGSPWAIEGLRKLVSQESTRADVVSALGEPRGYGLMRHAPDQPLRTVLAYNYIRARGDQKELSLLLVYLEGDRYDGHLWFSGRQLLERGPL